MLFFTVFWDKAEFIIKNCFLFVFFAKTRYKALMGQIKITGSARETREFGRFVAEKILKNKQGKSATVLALVGDLGGGKTTFLQGFARGLKIKEKILSPTFIIIRRIGFLLPKTGAGNFYHIDCYRIRNSEEILSLGFKGIIKDPGNVLAIEWADKIKKILPKKITVVNFYFISDKKRKIVIN